MLISLVVVTCMTCLGFYINVLIGYQGVALLMLMGVSILAMIFDIWPVLIASLLSALAWNYFFIPPVLTFTISSAEDVMLFSMYFMVALLNGILTYKIRDRNKKIREKEEKERAIELYRTVLNSLSHELRTPITAILGAVDLIKNKSGKLSDNQQQEVLDVLDKSTLRLNDQVGNLLSANRIEAGMVRLNLDWVDMQDLVADVLARIREMPVGQDIHVAYSNPLPLFKLDAVLMEHVLYNLIRNATLYTTSHTIINIVIDNPNDMCRIVIADNGQGFSASEKSQVFSMFYRRDAQLVSGTGLGLSIAKGFVEAHGGTIALSDTPGGGATFTILIPAESTFIKEVRHE